MYSDNPECFCLNDTVKIGKITKNKEFDRIFKEGGSSYDKLLGIKMVKNETDNVRLGVIASGKVSKRAVDRNKIRRRVKEIFRLTLDKIKPNDYVVVILPEARDKKFQDIKGSVIFNLKRLRALK